MSARVRAFLVPFRLNPLNELFERARLAGESARNVRVNQHETWLNKSLKWVRSQIRKFANCNVSFPKRNGLIGTTNHNDQRKRIRRRFARISSQLYSLCACCSQRTRARSLCPPRMGTKSSRDKTGNFWSAIISRTRRSELLRDHETRNMIKISLCEFTVFEPVSDKTYLGNLSACKSKIPLWMYYFYSSFIYRWRRRGELKNFCKFRIVSRERAWSNAAFLFPNEGNTAACLSRKLISACGYVTCDARIRSVESILSTSLVVERKIAIGNGGIDPLVRYSARESTTCVNPASIARDGGTMSVLSADVHGLPTVCRYDNFPNWLPDRSIQLCNYCDCSTEHTCLLDASKTSKRRPKEKVRHLWDMQERI